MSIVTANESSNQAIGGAASIAAYVLFHSLYHTRNLSKSNKYTARLDSNRLSFPLLCCWVGTQVRLPTRLRPGLDQVTVVTIMNYFRHCGCSVTSMDSTVEAMSNARQHDVSMRACGVPQDINFANYVDVDSSTMVCSALSNEDIVAQVVSKEPA